MDIGKSFTFILDDERKFEKLGLGAGVVLVSMLLAPVLIGLLGFFIVGGYTIRLLRNVRDGVERPLPEWDRWGDDMALGFKYFITQLIYVLPIFLIVIPMVIGTAIASQGRSGEQFGTMLIMCGGCLTALYALLFTVMQPGITIAFARDGEIRSGLQVSQIWEWTRRNIGPVLIAVLIYIAASTIIEILAVVAGTLLCVVGLIVTIPLGILLPYLVQAHLFGQLARDPLAGRDPFGALPLFPPSGAATPVTPAPVAPAPVIPPIDPTEPVDPFGPVDLSAPVEPVAAQAETIVPEVAIFETAPLETEPVVPPIEPPVSFDPPAIAQAPADPSLPEPPSPEEPQNPA